MSDKLFDLLLKILPSIVALFILLVGLNFPTNYYFQKREFNKKKEKIILFSERIFKQLAFSLQTKINEDINSMNQAREQQASFTINTFTILPLSNVENLIDTMFNDLYKFDDSKYLDKDIQVLYEIKANYILIENYINEMNKKIERNEYTEETYIRTLTVLMNDKIKPALKSFEDYKI